MKLQKKFETNLEDFGECFYVGRFSGDDFLEICKEAEKRNMSAFTKKELVIIQSTR